MKHVARAKDQFARDNIKSMLSKALDDSSYGVDALKAVAQYFNIKLAPGDEWVYEENIRDFTGSPYGWTPRNSGDLYFVYTSGLKPKTSKDASVLISGELFQDCRLNITCVGGVMAHEAAHSWIEFKIESGGSGGATDEDTQRGLVLNEEILADEMAMSLIGDPLGNLRGHKNFQLGDCSYYAYTCDNPSAALEAAYNIDLSDLAVSISP